MSTPHFTITMNNKFLKFILLLIICCLCTACIPNKASNTAPALTIENYTFFGEKQAVNIPSVPKKAIICGTSAIDTLIALDAQNSVEAVVLTENANPKAYKNILPHSEVFTQPLQIEYVVALQPDFIVGWRRFFAETQLGNTTNWIKNGIPAYIQDASGPIPAKGNFPPCTIESELTFIRNMGIVFNKAEKATAITNKIQEQLLQLRQLPTENNKVLFIEFLNGNIEVFGSDLLSGDIIKKMGGQIIEYGAPFVSQEEIMTVNPDHIFVVYHGSEADGQDALEAMQNPLFQHLTAIKNNHVHPLNYKMIVAPAVNISETLSYMEQCLH